MAYDQAILNNEYSIFSERTNVLFKIINSLEISHIGYRTRNDFSHQVSNISQCIDSLRKSQNKLSSGVMTAAVQLLQGINNELKNFTDRTFDDNSIEHFSRQLEGYSQQAQALQINAQLLQNDEIFNDAKRKLDAEAMAIQERLREFEKQSRNEIETIKLETTSDASEVKKMLFNLQQEVKEVKSRFDFDVKDFELLRLDKIFWDTANNNKKLRIWWIGGIAFAFGLLALLIFCFIKECWIDLDCYFHNRNTLLEIQKPAIGSIALENIKILLYYELAKKAVLRLFLISMTIFLLKFLIRNYNALMHNITINENKANTLAALMRSINIISKPEDRDTLIKIGAKEIFVQKKTGYLYKEDSDIDLSIFKKISSLFNKEK